MDHKFNFDFLQFWLEYACICLLMNTCPHLCLERITEASRVHVFVSLNNVKWFSKMIEPVVWEYSYCSTHWINYILLCFVLKILGFLVGRELCFSMLLIYSFLITSKIKHFLIYLLVFHLSLFVKYWKYFSHFMSVFCLWI